jgi:hypothetical protein
VFFEGVYRVKKQSRKHIVDRGSVVWPGKPSFSLVFLAGERLTDNPSSILLLAGSLMVLLLVLELVKLARSGSSVGLWFVIGWHGLSFDWL